MRADVRVEVTEDGDASRLEATTDLNLTGRIAALGRGVQDVSQQMFQDFAGQLAVQVAAPEPAARAGRQVGRHRGRWIRADRDGDRSAPRHLQRPRPRTRSA